MSSIKYIKKTYESSNGLYYSNLIGRAITTYNSKEKSFLTSSEVMVSFDNVKEIYLGKVIAETVVVFLMSGGAMPYRVGFWEQKTCLIGSLYSISVYEKIL